MPIKKITVLGIFVGITLSFGGVAYGAGEYQPLAPLPTISGTEQGTFTEYANAAISFIIGFSAVLAVLVLVYGGFMYMTGEALHTKEEGRKTMTNAVYGLVLILVSYIILNTINPDFLTLNLNVCTAGNQANCAGSDRAGGGTGGGNQNQQPSPIEDGLEYDQGAAGSVLANHGIQIKSSGNCTDPNVKTCTSLDGIKINTVNGALNLKNQCEKSDDCQFVITGGTETGHAGGAYSHGNGYKFDVSKNLGDASSFGNFLKGLNYTNQAGQSVSGSSINDSSNLNKNFYTSVGGYNYVIHPETNHWDITVLPTTSTIPEDYTEEAK